MISIPFFTPFSNAMRRGLLDYWLPLGLLLLLTGIFWFEDRSIYQRQYYIGFALPAFLAFLLCWRTVVPSIKPRLLLSVALFVCWAAISTNWTHTFNSEVRGAADLVRHAINLLWLFLGLQVLASVHPYRLEQTMRLAIILATATVLYYLVRYEMSLPAGQWLPLPGERMEGYHGLDNPLLTGHVVGFFLILSLVFAIHRGGWWWLLVPPYIVGVLSTGSRTTIFASTFAIMFMLLERRFRRDWLAVGILLLTCIPLYILFWDNLFDRGLSFRPQIWALAWQEILDSPWFGRGWGSPWRYDIQGVSQTLADPHNLTIAVWRDLGIPGLVLWLIMWGTAFRHAWRYRLAPYGQLCLGLLLYGFCSGLTEGGAFISRPKEHWFLIWIPLAFTACLLSRSSLRGQIGKPNLSGGAEVA